MVESRREKARRLLVSEKKCESCYAITELQGNFRSREMSCSVIFDTEHPLLKSTVLVKGTIGEFEDERIENRRLATYTFS